MLSRFRARRAPLRVRDAERNAPCFDALPPMTAPIFALKEELRRPEAYAEVTRQWAAPRLVETHLSWVFIHEHEVFKIKKPVNLGFVDFRFPWQRKAACDAEVRLNSRLAPDVYRGVVPIRCGPDGRARLGGDGPIIDWAVRMVRLDDERRADRLLARGELSRADVVAIATRIAVFHRAAPPVSIEEHLGDHLGVAANVEENLRQTKDALPKYLQSDEANELVSWQRMFAREHAGLLDERVRAGRVREGHGDLRLEHVYLDQRGVTIIDCVEFDPRYRVSDVAADIAFLSMDLAMHERSDLAEQFLAAYARETNDFDLYMLVNFYESYRAYVRGKVSVLTSSDPGVDAASRVRAEGEARRYFLLAMSADRSPLLTPVMLAVGGVMGSGKSTIAERLAEELGAPVIAADRVRKAMLGVEPTQALDTAPWSGAYDPVLTDRVYAEVLRSAEVVLCSGRSVVLDATFRSLAWRTAVRQLAASHPVPFRFVECKAPRDVCLRRLAERERTPSVSDGRRDIFDAFSERFEPVRELEPEEHVVVNTTEPIGTTLQRVRSAVDPWPDHLVA